MIRHTHLISAMPALKMLRKALETAEARDDEAEISLLGWQLCHSMLLGGEGQPRVKDFRGLVQQVRMGESFCMSCCSGDQRVTALCGGAACRRASAES